MVWPLYLNLKLIIAVFLCPIFRSFMVLIHAHLVKTSYENTLYIQTVRQLQEENHSKLLIAIHVKLF